MKALTIMWVLFCNLGGLLTWSKLGETRKRVRLKRLNIMPSTQNIE